MSFNKDQLKAWLENSKPTPQELEYHREMMEKLGMNPDGTPLEPKEPPCPTQ